MNNNCCLCGNPLDPNSIHDEHIIQNAIGGTLKPNKILLGRLFRPGVEAGHFHDTRLGEALDDLSEKAPTLCTEF